MAKEYLFNDDKYIILSGIGFDIHKLKKNLFRKNILSIGGYKFESTYKFIAHSDGDIIIHALIDSIVGILFNKDIGQLFPDTDIKYKNIDSTTLLQNILNKIKTEIIDHDIYLNFISFDIILCSDLIKILPIKENIIKSLNIYFPKSIINVKGKRTEGLFSKKYCICEVISTILIEKKYFEKNREK